MPTPAFLYAPWQHEEGLGGLARGTLDMALLLDAAGRDFVLIETVGVSRAKSQISLLADVTVFGSDARNG